MIILNMFVQACSWVWGKVGKATVSPAYLMGLDLGMEGEIVGGLLKNVFFFFFGLLQQELLL